MRSDPHDADRPQSPPTTTAITKWVRRTRPRTAIRPAGQCSAANLLTSFGMIASLLLVWALAVTM